MQSRILPITGDASFRKFFRISFKKKNKIIVVAQKDKYKNLTAYIAVNKYLRENHILAPKLYNYDYSKGVIIIEDFGDLSFHNLLKKNKKKFLIYKKLVDLLIKIQKIKPKKRIKNIKKKSHLIGYYSKKILHKESDLFFDWYLPLILNKKKTLKIKKKLKKSLSKLYNNLNFYNSHFVHRDYHVQNLIKVGNKIGVIDSQDALIGNPTYDLVSLIDDVRIKTSKKLKNKIYNYYLKKTFPVYRSNSKKFLEDFNTLSVQRNLKIIGIFSRLFKRDNKKKYLKLIPYTWKLLEMRMNNKNFSELKSVLNQGIKERVRKKIINQ
jgi:N-acetylmuramate 1-kinase